MKFPFKTCFYGMIFLGGWLLIMSPQSVSAESYVNGYYRANGTYVKPHTRSSPDSYRYNNYGSPSAKQSYSNFGVTPSWSRDSDSDGLSNQFDLDDNNDGQMDDYE
jgi:hypothetical protein